MNRTKQQRKNGTKPQSKRANENHKEETHKERPLTRRHMTKHLRPVDTDPVEGGVREVVDVVPANERSE